MTKRWLAVGAVLVVAIVAGSGLLIAAAAGDDENEQPITGTNLERASEAALAYTGGGRVTETEQGDEEGYYEVEVTLDDGTQVDVHLDKDFNVLNAENDGLGDDDESGGDDD
jgi:uncharacterized membrane protein YkoI